MVKWLLHRMHSLIIVSWASSWARIRNLVIIALCRGISSCEASSIKKAVGVRIPTRWSSVSKHPCSWKRARAVMCQPCLIRHRMELKYALTRRTLMATWREGSNWRRWTTVTTDSRMKEMVPQTCQRLKQGRAWPALLDSRLQRQH